MSKPNERKTSQLQVPPRLWTWLESVVAHAGFLEFDANDASAHVKTKVVEFLKEVEAGERQRPRRMEAYLKQVCRNALVDWIRDRQARGARSPSAAERSLLDNEMYSSSAEESDAERGGFHTTRAPSIRGQQRRQRPWLIQLISRHDRGLWDFNRRVIPVASRALYDSRPCPATILQADKRLRRLPHRTRQAARLYLMYWREAEIARQLGVSRAAVSNLLRRMRQTWGWDDRQVQFERMRLLWANLYVVVHEALKPFQLEDDDQLTESLSLDYFPSWPPDPPQIEEWQRFLGAPGWERSRVSKRDGWTVAWRRAREEAVFRALTASPALARCAKGITRDDVFTIVEFVDSMYEYDY